MTFKDLKCFRTSPCCTRHCSLFWMALKIIEDTGRIWLTKNYLNNNNKKHTKRTALANYWRSDERILFISPTKRVLEVWKQISNRFVYQRLSNFCDPFSPSKSTQDQQIICRSTVALFLSFILSTVESLCWYRVQMIEWQTFAKNDKFCRLVIYEKCSESRNMWKSPPRTSNFMESFP